MNLLHCGLRRINRKSTRQCAGGVAIDSVEAHIRCYAVVVRTALDLVTSHHQYVCMCFVDMVIMIAVCVRERQDDGQSDSLMFLSKAHLNVHELP